MQKQHFAIIVSQLFFTIQVVPPRPSLAI